jgi:hypothetical protein
MDEKPLTPDTPVGSLIPYYFQNQKNIEGGKMTEEFWCYNDIVKWGDLRTIIAQSSDYDPFGINSDTREQYHIPLKYDPSCKIRQLSK